MISTVLTARRRVITATALAVGCAMASPVAAQPAPSTDVVLLVGAGSWLPVPEYPSGMRGHRGHRILLGLQVERTLASRPAWAWAASVTGGASALDDPDDNIDAESGFVYDVALVRRLHAPGGWAFVYAGGSAGVVDFDETRFAPGVRVGADVGTWIGLRLEGRYQYLVGANRPHGKALVAGAHVRW